MLTCPLHSRCDCDQCTRYFSPCLRPPFASCHLYLIDLNFLGSLATSQKIKQQYRAGVVLLEGGKNKIGEERVGRNGEGRERGGRREGKEREKGGEGRERGGEGRERRGRREERST